MIPDTSQISEFFKKHALGKETPVILAISGGVDSMVLLDLMAHLGQSCIVGHINHGLRTSADSDEKSVRNVATRYGFPFESKRVHIQGGNIEQQGRQYRYDFLDEIREKYHAAWIITAHHSDDHLESQLLHLERGSGLFGLMGIQEHDEHRRLLRPLLIYSKPQLLAYARAHHLTYHEDSTNQDTHFARNNMRLEIIPKLLRALPDLKEILAYQGQCATHTLRKIHSTISTTLGDHFEIQSSWNYTLLLSLSPYFLRYALLFIMRRQLPHHTYTRAHLHEVSTKIRTLPSGKSLTLNATHILLRDFDTISLTIKKEHTSQKNVSYPLGLLLSQDLTLDNLIISMLPPRTAHTAVPLPKSPEHYMVTYRLPGMRILVHSPKGNFHQPLKKYLIQQQIPVDKRNTVPLLVDTETQDVIALLTKQYYTAPTDTPKHAYHLYLSHF